jgi:hypothetical protein
MSGYNCHGGILEFARALGLILATGILFGCIAPFTETGQVPPGANLTGPNITPGCKTVVTQEPYNKTQCQNVSKMDEVCVNRELNYTLSPTVKTDICVSSDLCVNPYPGGGCATYYCSKGQTRCRANLTNLDPQKSGTWSVGANFTMGGSVFGKDPVVETLLPGSTVPIDFQMLYNMDVNQVRPSCVVFVKSSPIIQDCNFITRITEDCQNVTEYKNVEKQVCQ